MHARVWLELIGTMLLGGLLMACCCYGLYRISKRKDKDAP